MCVIIKGTIFLYDINICNTNLYTRNSNSMSQYTSLSRNCILLHPSVMTMKVYFAFVTTIVALRCDITSKAK